MDINLMRLNPFYLDDKAVSWVIKTRNAMTLKEKIGQLFIPFCTDVSEKNLRLLLRYKPGGIHRLLRVPTKKLRQSAELLQKNSEVPLLMSADIEFYAVNHFLEGTRLQNELGIASTGDIAMAGRMGTVAGREGRYCGFNWSFTPCVDSGYNFRNPVVGTNCFGNDSEMIKAMSMAYILAMQAEGMAACAKHWPGDGVDDRDQHLVTSHNMMDMKKWRETFGSIYKSVIDSGVKTIMSAHITLPAYYREKDPGISADRILPASISKELNIDLLRGELGFNGLIVSDATSMVGLTSQGPREEIAPMVIENGCDIFLFSLDNDIDLTLILKAAESGRLSRERIDDSVTRILALKASLGLHVQQRKGDFLPPESSRKAYFRTRKHVQWEKEIAEKSITLVKDTQGLLPLSPEKNQKILIIRSKREDSSGRIPALMLRTLLEKSGFNVAEYQDDTIVDPDIFDVVLYLVDERTELFRGSLLMDDLSSGRVREMNCFWHTIPTLYISMGNPYHLYGVPRCKTYINTYSSIEPVQKALVDALTGKKPFLGRNPVDPFCGLEDARF
jgi:beta-N-acetylhexosaminidase